MGTVDPREVKGNWQQQIGNAKNFWDKLTEDELKESAGHPKKLSSLVQDRYGLTQDDADEEVENFLGDIQE